MSGKQPSVHQQTSIALANREAANKKRLVLIAMTILLCGRQTFAIRRHDDSTKTIEAQPTSNPGNFKVLLQFRVDAGDKDLELHMKNAPKNATHCSATIQNEIIDVICTLIRKHIVERVKKCRFYSVIADKVTNAANRKQLSLVICYFDSESKTAAEGLLDFTACHLGVTDHAIAETILDLLEKKHFDQDLILSCCVVKDTTVLVTWLEKSKEQQLVSPLNIHLLSTFIALPTSSI